MEQINIVKSLIEARKKKIIRLQYLPYSIEIAKKVWYGIAAELLGTVKITESTKECWTLLIKYIHSDISELFNEKGIYLCGNTGSGKTKTMEILLLYSEIDNVKYIVNEDEIKNFRFKIFSSIQIVSDYQEKGIEGIEKYKNYTNLLIDDLGSEQLEATHYGSKLNVIEHVIEHRYTKIGFTHFTSNLPMKSVSNIYGERVGSRIKEMCNEIQLQCDDFRI